MFAPADGSRDGPIVLDRRPCAVTNDAFRFFNDVSIPAYDTTGCEKNNGQSTISTTMDCDQNANIASVLIRTVFSSTLDIPTLPVAARSSRVFVYKWRGVGHLGKRSRLPIAAKTNRRRPLREQPRRLAKPASVTSESATEPAHRARRL